MTFFILSKSLLISFDFKLWNFVITIYEYFERLATIFSTPVFISLRFKGVALVDGRPKVEIIYSIVGDQPQMKVGLFFRGQNLYKVVNMFYREDEIKSTWIKFQHICKYITTVVTAIIFYITALDII